MDEARAQIPEGSIVTAEIQVVGYIDPEGSGDLQYCVWAGCDVPLSSALGLLDLAKNDLILRVQGDHEDQS